MGIITSFAASLTLAERKLAAIEDVERKRRWARRWLRASNLWDVAKGLRYRYRDQWWPIIIGVGLLAGRGWADGARPAGVMLLCLLGAAVVVFRVRRALHRRTEWVYAGACLGAVTLGLTLTSVIGTGVRWLNVAGLLAWVVASLLWWSHHEVRGWAGHTKSTLVNRWQTNVRDLVASPLAGATIGDPVPFEHGNSYIVDLVPGKQTLAIAQTALPKLETALDLPQENMIIERHPDYPKRPSRLRLQEITRSPIEQTVLFDRPRHESGQILLGPYSDGIGEAVLRLYTDNSMWSLFLLGGTGIGKTRLTEIIAITALDMRNVGQHTVIFYMDGQNGASSPTLFKHATWAVGVDGVFRMLAALERVAIYRQKQNRANIDQGFTPSAGRPGILVVVDEAHLVFSLAAQRFADAARSWRKLGIALFAADQDSTVDNTFGGKDILRSSLLAGNGLAMRVSSRIAGNLIAGLDMNPYDLPAIQGYGVLVAAPNSGIRTAPFRGRYAPDRKDEAKARAAGRELEVPTIEDWFEQYPPLELDKGAARAAGPDYRDRRERAEQEQQALLRYIHGYDIDADTEQALFETDPEPVEAGADGGGGRSMRQRILALDWDRYGEMERQQIITDLQADGGGEIKVDTFTKALGKLVRPGGELVKTDRGRYRKPT